MSPLPSTRTIPAGWSQHHAPVAAGGMNGKCRIYDPATTTTGWDVFTESATLDRGTPVYDGPARIEANRVTSDIIQADDQQSARSYLVQILFDAAPIEADWTLIPYAVTNDPALNDAVMHIDDVEHGTERFARDLFATLTDD